MRILFLSTWFPSPPDNGSKLRVYHLLRALARSHEVTLASFAFDTGRPSEPGNVRAWCRDIHTVQTNPFEVNRAGMLRTFLSPQPLASRPVPAMSQQLAAVSHTHAFDAVVASTEVMATYAFQMPPNTVRILEEHNSLTRWMHERYRGESGMLRGLRAWASWQKARRYEARLFPRFDLVTMVSEQDRDVYLANRPGFRDHLAVVPNGVDCAHNVPGLAQPQPAALVYNGALTYSANYDAMRWFLAEVYPHVRQAVPNVSLTITGSTQGVALTGLALDDTVRLTGFVPDVRLPVAGAAVCVVPIRRGGGTRLKILEAMALGTPVVATTKGAEGLNVQPGEHLVIAEDPIDFAAQAVRLLRDESERQRLAANARRLVETTYDWTQIGGRFVSLVEEAARQRKRTGNADA